MQDRGEIYRALLIIVVIPICARKNGISVVIYALVYLRHEQLKQVEHLVIFSTQFSCSSSPGEELTFEYGVESEFRGDTIFHCLCGAETCTGFMGRSKKLGGVNSRSFSLIKRKIFLNRLGSFVK